MSDLHADNSPFIAKLSVQQQQFINLILPKGYSLQQFTGIQTSIKGTTTRRININIKEDISVQKEQHEVKRRKIKSYENLQHEEKRNIVAKRDDISKLTMIVKKLKKHDSSWPFRMPVDPKALLIPNYLQVVLTPMDLHTIQENIKADKYEHSGEIQRDINQMLLNSYKFNSKDGQYFQATSKLEQYYQSLLLQNQLNVGKKQMPDRQKKKQQTLNNKCHQNEKTNQITQIQKDLMSLLKRANQIANKKKVRQKPVYVSLKSDGVITLKQKRQLTQQIKSLGEHHLSRIYQLIKNSTKDNHVYDLKNQEKSEILTFDLQKMDQKTIRQLQNYVRLQKNSVIHNEESMMDSYQNQYNFS